MIRKRSEEMFQGLLQNSNYHLVDLDKKLPLYYGIDGKGRFSLCYYSNQPSKDLSGTKVLDIVSGLVSSGQYATFMSLSDKNYQSAFFSLCDDIIAVLNDIPDNESGYVAFVQRIRTWKAMFARNFGKLSDREIQGLYGELFFMDNYMFRKYGKEKAILAWGGLMWTPCQGHIKKRPAY